MRSPNEPLVRFATPSDQAGALEPQPWHEIYSCRDQAEGLIQRVGRIVDETQVGNHNMLPRMLKGKIRSCCPPLASRALG